MEQRYTVTQTAEILGVRASVLRYVGGRTGTEDMQE